jgi:hypothetical protein
MSTATSLSVRAILNKAIAQTALPGHRAISGLTPPAKALAVASAAHTTRDAILLYVVPADPDIENAVADVRFFLGVLEAMSDAAAEASVLPFPSHQVDPYRGMSPHFRVSSPRRTRCCRASRRPNRCWPHRSTCAAASRSSRRRSPTSW